jgi:glycine cleavage system H protein
MANWNTPSDLKYMKTDEWIKIEGDTATIGISDYAQDQMNDITFVELPPVGESFSKGDRFATFESVKAESDVYLPVSGTVTEVNSALASNSELLNTDPYGSGWMIKVKITGDADNPDMMSAEQYAEYCSTR